MDSIKNTSLGELASQDSISNIFIFISDSLRFDHLPEWIRDRGLVAEAIAPSTFTASSLPSMLTGQYPSEHGIHTFSDSLTKRPALFREAENSGLSAETIWTHLDSAEKPPLKMLNLEPSRPLKLLDQPFIYVEHDKGGHAPYGFSFEECSSTREFYLNHVSGASEIPKLYQKSVDDSLARFQKRLDYLESENLFQDTLVIFASDHGELLGESKYGNLYGHGSPIVPELVRVPLVFLGAQLPTGELDMLLSGCDIAPTALGAINSNPNKSMAGTNLWNESTIERQLRSEIIHKLTIFNRVMSRYEATSIWDMDGGAVSQHGSTLLRMAASMYLNYFSADSAGLSRSQIDVSSLWKFIKLFSESNITYGSPGFDENDFDIPRVSHNRPAPKPTIDEETRQALEDMGYR